MGGGTPFLTKWHSLMFKQAYVSGLSVNVTRSDCSHHIVLPRPSAVAMFVLDYHATAARES